jgi:hypothetical protein
MIKSIKIVLKISLAFALCLAWLGSTECAEPRTIANLAEKPPDSTYTPPTLESSSTSNYNNYYNYRLMMAELLLTKEAYPGSVPDLL